MTFDSKVKMLGDLMKLDSGFAFKSSEWVEEGTPVIKIRNVKDGYVDLSGCSFVSEDSAKKASGWYGEHGNTLISLTGAGVGEIGRIREKQSGLINQRVGWVRPSDPLKRIIFITYFAISNLKLSNWLVEALNQMFHLKIF